MLLIAVRKETDLTNKPAESVDKSLDESLDESFVQTFPASDPASWTLDTKPESESSDQNRETKTE